MESSFELVHLDAEKAFNELIMLERALQDIADDSELATLTNVFSSFPANPIMSDSMMSVGDGNLNEGEHFSELLIVVVSPMQFNI